MSRSVLAQLAAVMLSAVTLHGGPPFLVLPETTSPDGKYAFAWGLPAEFKVDWDALREGKEDATIEDGTFHRDVENFLVDLQTNRVLRSHTTAQAWSLPNGTHGNHRNLQVCWSPESDLAIAGYSEKWGYLSVEAFRITEKGALPVVQIGELLEKPWRAHLARTEGKRYARRAKKLEVSLSEFQAHGGGKFSTNAFAEVPKGTEDGDLFEEQRIRFTLTPKGKADLALKILAIEAIPEIDDALAKRLEEGDRQLNDSYRALIGALDAAGVETLRVEQRAWLKERDAEGKAGERARLIEERAGELGLRLRKLKQ
jgi:hypothetical protein